MNTRLWLSALSLSGLLLAGCAQPASEPASPPAEAPADGGTTDDGGEAAGDTQSEMEE